MTLSAVTYYITFSSYYVHYDATTLLIILLPHYIIPLLIFFLLWFMPSPPFPLPPRHHYLSFTTLRWMKTSCASFLAVAFLFAFRELFFFATAWFSIRYFRPLPANSHYWLRRDVIVYSRSAHTLLIFSFFTMFRHMSRKFRWYFTNIIRVNYTDDIRFSRYRATVTACSSAVSPLHYREYASVIFDRY
jgi:hypothetical protein